MVSISDLCPLSYLDEVAGRFQKCSTEHFMTDNNTRMKLDLY